MAWGGMRAGGPSLSDSKLSTDQAAESLFYFRMTGNWGTTTGLGVGVDIVLLPSTLEQATGCRHLAEELAALHAEIAMGLDRARRRAAGCSLRISR